MQILRHHVFVAPLIRVFTHPHVHDDQAAVCGLALPDVKLGELEAETDSAACFTPKAV